MIDGVDPEVARLMQENAQLKKLMQQLGLKLQNKEGANVVKLEAVRDTNRTRLQTTRETNATKVATERMRHGQSSREILAGHIMSLEQSRSEAELLRQMPQGQQGA